MVRSYTATVRRGAVTVRDVGIPNGTEVCVSIAEEPELVLTEEDLAGIRQAEAEYERGEYISGEQLVAELRAATARGQRERDRGTGDQARKRVVERAPAV